MYSFFQRLRSLRHRFWYGVSERVRWSRGEFCELPARELPALTFEQSKIIAALRERYQVDFAASLNATSSVNNYEYLDILDRVWREQQLPRRAGGVVHDVGCASFWYAAALHAFFRPLLLVGVDVEGHRLFADGHTRIDYAKGYVKHLPQTRFVVADYRRFAQRADVITAWFPFVTPAAILAWRLPLSLLTPHALFQQIYHNLKPGGLFLMVNHGSREADIAQSLCSAVGLSRIFTSSQGTALGGHRAEVPVVSGWQR